MSIRYCKVVVTEKSQWKKWSSLQEYLYCSFLLSFLILSGEHDLPLPKLGIIAVSFIYSILLFKRIENILCFTQTLFFASKISWVPSPLIEICERIYGTTRLIYEFSSEFSFFEEYYSRWHSVQAVLHRSGRVMNKSEWHIEESLMRLEKP